MFLSQLPYFKMKKIVFPSWNCFHVRFPSYLFPYFGTVRWTLVKGDQLTCTDSPDTCQRSLCECDAQFAKDHMATKDVFDPSYQTFYASPDGKEMWHAREKCPRSGTRGLYNPQCCTNRMVSIFFKKSGFISNLFP